MFCLCHAKLGLDQNYPLRKITLLATNFLQSTIYAASNAGFLGTTATFGDPRDVYINGVNASLSAASSAVQRGRYQSGNVVVGGFNNDYLTAYNPNTSGIDVLAGGKGADTFVAGDRSGIHYLGKNGVVVADYNYLEGDVVQLSSLGAGRYTQRQQNLGLGGSALDTGLYYNNKLVMAISDASVVRFLYG